MPVTASRGLEVGLGDPPSTKANGARIEQHAQLNQQTIAGLQAAQQRT